MSVFKVRNETLVELDNVALDTPILEILEHKNSLRGLLFAIFIISLWLISTSTFLLIDLENFPGWLLPIAICWQMFLYTGLFITAHDAMHGSVCSQNLKINHWIGCFCVSVYSFFPYQKLLQNHHLHHRYPASDRDPDFHDGKHKQPLCWYLCFMKRYWSWKQLAIAVLVFHSSQFFLHISSENLVLFWVIPSVLSSIQLFFFGTFLPHREPAEGYCYPHCAQTNALPVFWSFITCYHFGYHEEHHQYPHLPWWKLPAAHRFHSVI